MSEIDYVRSRRETARILGGISLRTLRDKFEIPGLLRATQLTERIRGYRDSEIKRFLDERTSTK